MLAVALGLGVPAAAEAAAPRNESRPTISGAAREGQSLTSAVGSWSGTAPIVYKRRWLRCDRDGHNCVALAATGDSYTAVAQDVGSTLRVRVEGSNAEGVVYALSLATALVSGNPPSNTSPPVVSGNTRAGQLLTAKPGTWAGTQPFTFAYSWRRCGADGAACTPIAGATSTTYRLTDADLGARIRANVVASNAAGTGEGSSAATAIIAPAEPPAVVTPPSVSGVLRDGQALTVDNGTWSGVATISYKYSWWRCDALEAGCSPISGALAKTYTLSPADVDRRIRVIVTATNPDGSATHTTAATGLVAVNPPANTSPPIVGGVTRTGQVLTAKLGSWTGTPTLVYAFQWLRCDANGAGCLPIEGATASTYTIPEADLGARIAVRVTASNPGGAATKDSLATATAVTTAQPPVNVTLPSVTGVLRDGETLTGGSGTWSGIATIGYTRRWLRCNGAGHDCAPVPGATATTYRLTAADVGHTVRLEVIATNPDGVASARSAALAVGAAPPAVTRQPAMTGTPRDGQTLTLATGTWTGTPELALAIQWERCDASGADCAAIPGAQSGTYVHTPPDIGSRIRARVTGSNAAGTATAHTAIGAIVEAAPPVATSLPGISGTARDGQLLTGTRGGWTGTEPIAYNWQWRRCSPTGLSCVNIPGADDATYRLTPADVKSTIRLRIEATNVRLMTPVESPPTAAIQAAKPSLVTAPEIAGATRDGETLTATDGEWDGTPVIVHTYQWERCALPDACEAILGATGKTYVLTASDLGSPVRVRVTATNAGGSLAEYSAATQPIATVAPASTALPAITGTPRDAALLTASPGTWTGTVPQARTYRWRRCDAAGSGCADIAGATASTYRLTVADVGSTVRVVVSSANAAGTATATSARTPLVSPDPPANAVLPVVTGELRDGRTLRADHGEWTGTPTLGYGYRWQRCTETLGTLDCKDIEGASSPTYTLRTADAQHRVRLVLTASNAGGNASATSAPTGVVQSNPPVNVELPRIEGLVRDGDDLTAQPGTWTGVLSFAYAYQWQRCDVQGDNCGDITGATERTYRVTATDVGVTIRVEVIARNAGGASAAISEATTVGTHRPPASLAVPTIAGYTGIGQELTSVDGGWLGSPPLAFTRQWLRCSATGGDCTPIAGQTGRDYELVPADLGHRIRVRVRAANAAGAAVADSAPTRLVSDDPPVSREAPAITSLSVHAVGVRLAGGTGTWAGAGPLTASYRWRRCDQSGDACADIIDAKERTYVPRPDDVGRTLRVTVTMDNGVGAASATSAQTPVIRIAPPANLEVPILKAGGGLQPGTELSATEGRWSGAAPIAFTYAWLRCDPAGGGCVPVPGAGGATYALTDADIGRSIRVRVTATNPTLTVSAQSETLGEVVPVAPAGVAKPTVAIDGGPGTKPRVGVQVRGEGGTWSGTGPLRFTYRWQRCSSASDCQDIPGADAITYTLAEGDVAHGVRLLVVAENSGGSVSAASASTAAVAGAPPFVLDRPRAVLAGPAVEGVRVTAETGEWGGTGVPSFSYQWQRCKEEGACKPIPRATDRDYTVTVADVGQKMAVLVTATSTYGKTPSLSPATTTILAVAPSGGRRPTVTRLPGRLRVGSRMLAEPGEWHGTKPLTLSYQWLRCDDRGRRCTDIDKATRKDYALTAADFEEEVLTGSLRVAVTARNDAGAASATSEPFGEDTGGRTGPRRRAKPKATPKVAKVKVPLTANTMRFNKRGRLMVRLSCAKTVKGATGPKGCAGQLLVAGPAVEKTVKFNLRPGKTRRYSVKLKPKQKKVAARAKAVRATLTLTVTGEAAPRTFAATAKVPPKLLKRFRRGR